MSQITPHDSTGTTFSFAGGGYTVTSIVFNLADPATDNTIDVSHLGLTAGASAKTMDRPLKGNSTDTGRQVTIEYLGKSIIEDTSTGTLVITHAGASFLSKASTVVSSSVTFAVNDVIKGQAVFKVSRD
jgi:hypothetical protein